MSKKHINHSKSPHFNHKFQNLPIFLKKSIPVYIIKDKKGIKYG